MKYITLVVTLFGLTTGLSSAEKIATPVLLTPSDAKKDIAKEGITFTWQKPSNEATTSIFGYRLIVSENSRFYGYNADTDACNNSCYLFLEDKNTFKKTINVNLANKVYYWKVQAFGAKDSGLWSTTNTFQTKKDIATPTITKIFTTPNSITQGDSITFNAALSSELPTGYSVKVDYGNGLFSMKGSGTNYSFSTTPALSGSSLYSVGIYNAQNTLQATKQQGNFSVNPPKPVTHKPTLIRISAENASTTINTAFSVQVSGNDVDGNLSSIVIDWGDGATSDPQSAQNGGNVTFTHIYTTDGTYKWNAVAYDDTALKSEPVQGSISVTKSAEPNKIDNSTGNSAETISLHLTATCTTTATDIKQYTCDSDVATISAPAGYVLDKNSLTGGESSGSGQEHSCNLNWSANSSTLTLQTHAKSPTGLFTGRGWETCDYDVSAKRAYTKIANDGSTLSDNAVLGTNPKDWACTRDNLTGLIWEMKTNDSGLHGKDWIFTWYEPDASKNGGYVGNENSGLNTFAYTNSMNSQGLCGAKDWRLPTNEELKQLIFCADGKTQTVAKEQNGYICIGLPTSPTINEIYFPNSVANFFWSSSPSMTESNNAWGVGFNGGFSDYGNKNSNHNVRLVRQLPLPAYSKIANDGSVLSDSAKLGTAPTDWACTKDNKTGLIWEVKTTDGGLRDWKNTYTWDNSFKFATDVNLQGLCGAKDWRLPTKEELENLLTTTSVLNQPSNIELYIDANYFPNTSTGSWSSSLSGYAWLVNFDGGGSYRYSRDSNYYVRLVR